MKYAWTQQQRPAPNSLERGFMADAPDPKWVTYITYQSIGAGWVYLAVVLDLFSCKGVGWGRCAIRWRRNWGVKPLRAAVETRRPTGEVLHHSDRGCQYTSDA